MLKNIAKEEKILLCCMFIKFIKILFYSEWWKLKKLYGHLIGKKQDLELEKTQWFLDWEYRSCKQTLK